MRLREAVVGKPLEADEFDNYMITVKFKRSDEIRNDKHLTELWGMNAH
jgi:hypothetical protein